MNDSAQGVIAAAFIAFFIFLSIVVNTPALTGSPLIQVPGQEEIMIENETESNNMTTISNNNSSNNTE